MPKRSIELNLQRAFAGNEDLFYDQTTFGNYSDRSVRLALGGGGGGGGGSGGGGGGGGGGGSGGAVVSGGGDDGEEGAAYLTDFTMAPTLSQSSMSNVLPLQAWSVYREQVRHIPTDIIYTTNRI